MHEQDTGSPRQECAYEVRVGDVRQVNALLGEVMDVLLEGLPFLLLELLQILGVSRRM